ncbi:transcriptional regulator BolA [Vibrio gangliei]|uniref:transcriptional regulator BolA n=1 Tax=Vibrio gangliei TaxID=2077090 RepID=UPI000D0205A1|nr:transcriptional regulator BolA [Vibrio gangliei]
MIQDLIERKLQSAFTPIHLEVLNESYMHNVPPGSESHFKVVLVSESFEGKRLIARHRAINEVLADELENHIHALSIHTYTEVEWNEINGAFPSSPKCAGGGQ